MAIEYFLKLGDLKGESASSKHKDEIELLSRSWGASNPTSIAGTGLSGGKVSMSDITFSKAVDKSSPKLLELCCTGKHVAKGTLSCQKSVGDKNPADYLVIEFEEIAISSFQTGGSSGDSVGAESLSMAFVKVKYSYNVQEKDGKVQNAGSSSWDAGARESS